MLPGGGRWAKEKPASRCRWLEACGWRTEMIERRHHGDIVLTEADPPYLLSGLDRLKPRLILARHGFPYMLDAGIGHGAGDFEGIQTSHDRQGTVRLRGFGPDSSRGEARDAKPPARDMSISYLQARPIRNWNRRSANAARWNLPKQASRCRLSAQRPAQSLSLN